LVGLWFNSLLAAEAEAAERRAGLRDRFTIPKAIGPSPLGEVVEALCERGEGEGWWWRILVDENAFVARGVEDICGIEVDVAAGKDVELREVLRDMLQPIGASYRLTSWVESFPDDVMLRYKGSKERNLIIIVPNGDSPWRRPQIRTAKPKEI